MIPRDYQSSAVQAAYDFMQEKPVTENPLIVLPTGAGKSLVMAMICRDSVVAWNGRVLVLAHVKELLEQTANTLRALCPTVQVGVYSAGLKRRDTTQSVIVAGIQSVYDKADQLGAFQICLIDEVHLVPEAGEGRYRTLIADLLDINPDLRIIGLTATPYRLDSGPICGPGKLFTEICYEVSVKVLMNRGFLCKLISKAALAQVDTSTLRVVRGEFDPEEAARIFDDAAEPAALEILELTIGNQRHSVLIFCQNISHARTVARILRGKAAGIRAEGRTQLAAAGDLFAPPTSDIEVGMVADYLEDAGLPTDALRYSLNDAMNVGEVYGDTPADDRAEILADFKAGRLKYVVNVGVWTTGFDAPNVDCVCLLRATASAGLMYQMLGRGFRIDPDAPDENCLILDFGENIQRHGPVDRIRPKIKGAKQEDAGKICPDCRSVVARNATVCLDCGHVWEQAERKPSGHNSRAGSEDVVSGDSVIEAAAVLSTTYKVHHKKDAPPDAPKTLRVTYQLGAAEWVSEWICVEHSGFAHRKAKTWWEQRCAVEMPKSAAAAVEAANCGWIPETISVSVLRTPGTKFPEIVGHEFGSKPTKSQPCPKCEADDRRVLMQNDNPKVPYKVVCGMCGFVHNYAEHDTAAAFGVFDPDNEEFRGEIRFEASEALMPRVIARWEPKGKPVLAGALGEEENIPF